MKDKPNQRGPRAKNERSAMQSYSNLIKLTGLTGSDVRLDPEIIVALVELGESEESEKGTCKDIVNCPTRTRIDIRDESKVVWGAYIVKQTATQINILIETVIARNQMKVKKVASGIIDTIAADIKNNGRVADAIRAIK